MGICLAPISTFRRQKSLRFCVFYLVICDMSIASSLLLVWWQGSGILGRTANPKDVI